MRPKIIYCYDAYCGWCYGFSPVIKAIWIKYRDQFDFETLSGGMIPVESTKHIGVMAGYIQQAYKTVEERTGIQFGEDYLWHINNPDKSDWYPHSEMAAIALSVLREYHPERSIEMAADFQYALHAEGRDLTDKEAYRHLLEKYSVDPDGFYAKLADASYREKAYYDFTLVKQLNVNGFPTAFLQLEEGKFYMIARGYSDVEEVDQRIRNIMTEFNSAKWS